VGWGGGGGGGGGGNSCITAKRDFAQPAIINFLGGFNILNLILIDS
jgi:hypothetical protein